MLIDGGKGQLVTAISVRDSLGYQKIPFIGLAERQEQIITKDIIINYEKVLKIGGSIEENDGFILK